MSGGDADAIAGADGKEAKGSAEGEAAAAKVDTHINYTLALMYAILSLSLTQSLSI